MAAYKLSELPEEMSNKAIGRAFSKVLTKRLRWSRFIKSTGPTRRNGFG
jgi:hypothetical protein